MLLLVRRHFWLLGLGAVLVCGLLGYSGVHQLAAADELALPPSDVGAAPVAVAPRLAPDKDGDALAARNMFCSSCAPAEANVIEAAPHDGQVPLTALPLELLATSLGDASFATVRRADTEQQGAYWIGDRLPGAGPVERVGGSNVIFHNPATNRLERLSLVPSAAAARPLPAAAATGAPSSYADRIRDAGNDRYEVEASLVKELTENPMAIKGVRFLPSVSSGAIDGFRLVHARPDSIANAMGLRRGDVVQAINGHALTSADALLDVYSKLRDQKSFQATVVRDGAPVTLSYDVR